MIPLLFSFIIQSKDKSNFFFIIYYDVVFYLSGRFTLSDLF